MSRTTEQQRLYMQRYRAAHPDKMRRDMRARRAARRDWVHQALGGACVRCGSTTDLHCDHVDPATKTASIGAIYTAPKAVLLTELAKCQLLCKPCHKAKTKENGDQTRHPAQHGTVSMYVYRKCRCDACVHAHRAYDRERYRRLRAQSSASSGPASSSSSP